MLPNMCYDSRDEIHLLTAATMNDNCIQNEKLKTCK